MKFTRQKRLKLEGWGIPLGYALLTLLVGMALPRLEHRYFPQFVSTMSASAAMSICSSISSGMIALTGIVFSLTFLMVQFSATAYSPRLVLWVARDPVMSHALGIFNATFLYALMLLAWIDRGASGKVPLFSGWLVLGLLLASMGMFIALIERVGLLQINRMLIFTADQGRKAISELNRSNKLAAANIDTLASRNALHVQVVAHTGRPQVIQALRLDALVLLASRHNAQIEVIAPAGETVLETTPLLRVHGTAALDEAALLDAIQFGDERTFEQDPQYAIRLVVDIAIKALSAAINDPTTAVQALDQVEDLLLRLGRGRLDAGVYLDDRGIPRVTVPFPSWDDLLRLALDEIRFYGAGSVQVMRRMRALIKNLTAVLPQERHAALQHWEERLQGTVARTFSDAEEMLDASVPDRQGFGIGEENPARATRG